MEEKIILDIEREALTAILEYRKEAGLTETQLGEKAFPEAKNPRLKISSMWHARGKGNDGLRLRLGDFCSMCEALGKNPAQVLLLIYGKANP